MPQLFVIFDKAKETRAQLPIHKEGAIPAFYDLFVDVPDQPGIIAEITQILGEADLSLTNIKILETREEIYGILQLSFKNQSDCQAAKQILSKNELYVLRKIRGDEGATTYKCETFTRDSDGS